MSLRYHTSPFDHQSDECERFWRVPARGLFWEQGTGKSKATIDQLVALYREGRIDSIVITAPNGVHLNWATDEFKAHCGVRYDCFVFQSSKSRTKKFQRAWASFKAWTRGLPVLLISYDGFMTKNGKAAFTAFCKTRRPAWVLDESQRIKTPSSKRSLSVVARSKGFKYKRVLSGTPITKSPFDIYKQVAFLDDGFWEANGFASLTAFQSYFGVQKEFVQYDDEGNEAGRFKKWVEFRNLAELYDLISKVSSRVLKEDVLDLPPKLYTQRYVELSPEQRKLYKQLKEEFFAFLASGEMVTAPMMIVRLLRLQQILSGYLPSDDCEHMNLLQDNPRLDALIELLGDLDGPAIIFSRFTQDIDAITEVLRGNCVRYDGRVSDDERAIAKARFQDPDGPDYFVGNQAACCTGLTLHRARNVIYYSNSFNLEHRLQSEDRAHRIGQNFPVTYYDLIAAGTVDKHIVKSLRSKFDVAAQVNGDAVRHWLSEGDDS